MHSLNAYLDTQSLKELAKLSRRSLHLEICGKIWYYIMMIFKYRVVIISFIIICLLLLAYDITYILSGASSCGNLTTNPKANNFLWFFSRSVSLYIWVIPIIYVFWPSRIRHA